MTCTENNKMLNKTKTLLGNFLNDLVMQAHLRRVYYGKYAEQTSIISIRVRLYEVELVYSGQSQ